MLDVEGTQAAEWKEPVINFPSGATTRFPAEKDHGDDRTQEKFVKEGVAFSWETVSGSIHQRALLKVCVWCLAC